MKLLKNILLVTALAGGLTVSLPPIAGHAVNPSAFNEACKSGAASDSTFCTDSRRATSSNPLTGSDGVIMDVVNIVALIAGAAAVIIIVLAGLRFVSSGGSSEDIAGARRTIIYALVGLVILVLARTLVAFIIGRL